jgi:spore maturation protein CgeB
MKILQVALGNQFDIRDALTTIGDVIYWDWSGHNRTFNQSIRRLVDQHKPDLVFLQIQTPGIIDVHTAQYIASKSFVVNWTGDVRQNIDWFIQVGKVIQMTLFTNMEDVKTLRSKGIKSDYLQIGFPTKIFKPSGTIKAGVPEIIFMANQTQGFPLSNYRKEIVEELRRRYGSRFGVFGNSWGWGYSVPDQNEEAAHYRGCKIAINLSHFNYSRYSSDRIFRLMGAGAFCLSHNYQDIEKEFEIGKYLDVWNDKDELFRKIDYYLENDLERKAIAKSGCKHVHKNHTWNERIKQLIQITK